MDKELVQEARNEAQRCRADYMNCVLCGNKAMTCCYDTQNCLTSWQTVSRKAR